MISLAWMLGKGERQWIMYLHADDKWICSYIHLLIHTFELQFRLPLYFITNHLSFNLSLDTFGCSPLWWLKLWKCKEDLNIPVKKQQKCSTRLFCWFFPSLYPFLSPALVNLCKTLCTAFLLYPRPSFHPPSFSFLFPSEDELKRREALINTPQSSAKFYKAERKCQLRRRCRASGSGSQRCLWMPEGP